MTTAFASRWGAAKQNHKFRPSERYPQSMILLIDNYDSFVYNLSRYFRELGCETVVVRNDAVSLGDVRQIKPAAIVLSPGPCTPDEAGISVELVRSFHTDVPLLGVCLGFQAIAAV